MYYQRRYDFQVMKMCITGYGIMANSIQAVIGFSGYDAIRAMCYAFHGYAIENISIDNSKLSFINCVLPKAL